MTTTQGTVAAIAAVVVFWIVGAYNRLVSLRNELVARFAAGRRALPAAPCAARTPARAAGDGAGRRRAPRLDALRAACRQADAAREHARARPGAASAVTSLRVAEDILADARARLPVQIGGRRRAARAQRPAGDERHRARRSRAPSSTPRSTPTTRRCASSRPCSSPACSAFAPRPRSSGGATETAHGRRPCARATRPRRPATVPVASALASASAVAGARARRRRPAVAGARRRRAARRAAGAAAAARQPARRSRLAASRPRRRRAPSAARARGEPVGRGAPAVVRAAAGAHGAAADRRPAGAAAGDASRHGRARRRPADRPPALAGDAARPRRGAGRWRRGPKPHADVAEWLETDVLASPSTPPSCRAWSPGQTDESAAAALVRDRHGDMAAASPRSAAWRRRTPRAMFEALARLQTLSWMQRPVVVRSWVAAAMRRSRRRAPRRPLGRRAAPDLQPARLADAARAGAALHHAARRRRQVSEARRLAGSAPTSPRPRTDDMTDEALPQTKTRTAPRPSRTSRRASCSTCRSTCATSRWSSSP